MYPLYNPLHSLQMIDAQFFYLMDSIHASEATVRMYVHTIYSKTVVVRVKIGYSQKKFAKVYSGLGGC